MRNPVSTRKLKYDGQAKSDWHGDLVEAIGERWLVVHYAHPPHRTETGEKAAYGLRYFGLDIPLSVLISFDLLGRVLEYQCDAALPATLRDRRISFIDLDLDVMADASLHTRLRDEETFERHRESLGYPADVVDKAWEGVRLARELIAHRVCPFDGSAESLLGRILASQGPL